MLTVILCIVVAVLAFFFGYLFCLYRTVEHLFKSHSAEQCPGCGKDANWSLLRSNNVKKCTSCSYEKSWYLDKGQLPLIRSNRMVKRNDHQKKNC